MLKAISRDDGLDPEGARDRALASRAYRHMLAKLRAHRINGETTTIRDREVFGITRDLVRDLARATYARLTAGQRRVCLRVLDLEELPPLGPAGPHPLDTMASARPLHPPGRAAR